MCWKNLVIKLKLFQGVTLMDVRCNFKLQLVNCPFYPTNNQLHKALKVQNSSSILQVHELQCSLHYHDQRGLLLIVVKSTIMTPFVPKLMFTHILTYLKLYCYQILWCFTYINLSLIVLLSNTMAWDWHCICTSNAI